MLGGVPRHALMSEGEDYRLDVERIDAAIAPRTKALLINTPVNPTGHIATRRELEETPMPHGVATSSSWPMRPTSGWCSTV